jgi:Xaa-Pro aminopeptidase
MTNIQKIQNALDGQNANAVLITAPVNRRFATGFPSTAGVVLVTKADAWFFTDSRYMEAASQAIHSAQVQEVDAKHSYSDRINAILIEYGISKLAFEATSVSYADYLNWSKKLKAELVPAGDMLDKLRGVKDDTDLEKMIVAQRIAEKSFLEILPLISTEMTERELATELMYRFYKNGADDKSFDPIVVSGQRSSMPHGVPEDRKISLGFLTMDFGVVKDGWCSDTTRTICIGQPTEEMVRVYDTVLKAQIAGIKRAKAGVLCSEIDGAARGIIDKAGYGAYFGHSFGHGLGMEVHEYPNASPKNETPISAGAVISAEPGIYLPGRFGVRIEDVIYITENGCENLTSLSKELICI